MSAWAALLEELYALSPRGIQPGLERMRAALERVGNPQRAFEVVHIAGTNGKGSVAAMLSAGLRVLEQEGAETSVGRFTSPHLHCLTERFVIDGEPVERSVVIRTWDRLRGALEGVPLTFFETITVLAFVMFRDLGVELAVLETGLGGRLDSTNVSERKLVTAITRVAVDHRSWLGDDIVGIAAEKAGILVPGVPCVVGPQLPAVDEEISRIAATVGAPILRPRHVTSSSALHFAVADWTSPPLTLGLAGRHQRENAAVAIGALRALELRGFTVDFQRALECHWPGRLERFGDSPQVLLDVAHNPNAAVALAAHLRETSPGPVNGSSTLLVFGAMRDKDWPQMLGALRPRFSRVVLTRAQLGRAQEPAKMATPDDIVEPSVIEALDRAGELAGADGLVVVAGSSFVVAEARAHLLSIHADPPIAF